MGDADEVGPVYGVKLIDALPIADGGGMLQAMPSAQDLKKVMARVGPRTVAGYEVLLSRYRAKCEEVERLKAELRLR